MKSLAQTVRVAGVMLFACLALSGCVNGLDLSGQSLEERLTGHTVVFDPPEGPREIDAEITVLAMGGASWRRLGSDGAWAAQMPSMSWRDFRGRFSTRSS